MASAKQLPSGQWRTLVYSHTDIINGKKIRRYESFTADTKRESEFMAANFALNKDTAEKTENITLGEAMDRYISSKSNILSPTTIRGYKAVRRNCFQALENIQLSKLTQSKIQMAFNYESSIHSPKYVKNAHGLLSATLSAFRPSFVLRTTLPKKIRHENYIPNNEDIIRLISITKGTDLYIPVLLASTLSLRRSEICGLQKRDINFKTGVLSVRRAVVLKEKENSYSQEWIIKPPKTFTSSRDIIMPQTVADVLKDAVINKKATDFVVDINPSVITLRFIKIIKNNGFQHFRFHDLRHYNASVMLALNTPDKYAMERGGWSTMSVMKERYQHTFSEEKIRCENIINNFFDELCNTKCNTKN